MLLQTDKRFKKSIRDYGCFLLSSIYGALKATNRLDEFTFEFVMDVYNSGVIHGWIMDDGVEWNCYVKDLWSIYHLYKFPILGMEHLRTFSKRGKSFDLIKLQIPGKKLGHWVCGDGAGKVLYDPDPDSETSRLGSRDSRWLIKFKEGK